MEHMALYRKYRPRAFEDVCGQEHITSVLKYEAENGKLSHAYLFCGPRGTGKTTCAKILAKAVNCETPVAGDPCGKCFHCQSIDDGSATDVLEMDAASNTGVDYIREIRDEVTYSPAVMKKRVYIIDEVHMLSIGAFNALLKTLEEPPEHVLFILATTEQHKLPATIVSRCQRFDFRRISVNDICSRLLYIAEKENIALNKEAAEIIAKQAQGGMRDAINLFELCAGGGRGVTSERVRETLGISGIENAYKTAIAVSTNSVNDIFAAIENITRSSKDVSVFWQELISFWRDMMVEKSAEDSKKYLDLTESEEDLLNNAAKRFSLAELIYHSELLDDAALKMNRLPQIKRNIAELTLIKMASPSLSTSPNALAARITALEDKLKLMGTSAFRKEIKNDDFIGDNTKSETLIKNSEKTDNISDKSKRGAVSHEEAQSRSLETKNGFVPVRGKGELSDKISSLNPMLTGFITASELYFNKETNEILIKCENNFTANMLSADDAVRTISDSFVLCGLAGHDPIIKVEIGEVKKDADPFDEFKDI